MTGPPCDRWARGVSGDISSDVSSALSRFFFVPWATTQISGSSAKQPSVLSETVSGQGPRLSRYVGPDERWEPRLGSFLGAQVLHLGQGLHHEPEGVWSLFRHPSFFIFSLGCIFSMLWTAFSALPQGCARPEQGCGEGCHAVRRASWAFQTSGCSGCCRPGAKGRNI